ncbi:MAG: hypothetical protein AAF763_01570 [Pseudomonadota bacterium]
MKIVLHIGLHRTGTTALQAALASGGARLREKGVWFEPTAQVRPVIATPLGAAAKAGPLAGAARRWARASIRRWVRAREDEGVRRLVLSDETMLGLMERSLGPAGIYPDAAARLGLLAEALDGWETQAHAGLRPPAEWYPSVYAFALSRRPQADGFEPVRRAALEAERGQAALARDVHAVFPGPIFWTSDFHGAHAGRVRRMLTGQRFARRLRPPRRRTNVSLSAPALARLEALRADGREVDRSVVIALRREAPVRRAGAWDPWSAAEQEALAARWREEIAAIRGAGLRVLGGGRVLGGRGRGRRGRLRPAGDETGAAAYIGGEAVPVRGASQGGAR